MPDRNSATSILLAVCECVPRICVTEALENAMCVGNWLANSGRLWANQIRLWIGNQSCPCCQASIRAIFPSESQSPKNTPVFAPGSSSYIVLRPQFPTARSSLPSPSKSPAAIPVHHPVLPPKPHSEVLSSNRPWLFRNTRTESHSTARARSGQPSPSMSANVAPLTRPSAAKGWLAELESLNSPPSLSHSVEETGSGYRPGANRPPTKRSRSPSPSTSASATGPMLALAMDSLFGAARFVSA